MPRSKSEQEAIAFAVTGHFEGEGYTERTGNFDGAGWSLGLLQWNFGQGSLQPMLKAMHDAGPATWARHLGTDLGAELLAVCSWPSAKAVAWADSRSAGEGKARIAEPWNSRLKALLADPGFQAIQRHHAQPYLADARADAKFYGVETLRGLSFFLDVAVQNGPGKLGATAKASVKAAFAARGGHALPPREKLVALAQVVAESCNPRWKAVVLARKLAIAEGAGVVYGSRVDLGARFGLSDEVLA